MIKSTTFANTYFTKNEGEFACMGLHCDFNIRQQSAIVSLEIIFQRYGGDLLKINMTKWIVRLVNSLQPLLDLYRDSFTLNCGNDADMKKEYIVEIYI